MAQIVGQTIPLPWILAAAGGIAAVLGHFWGLPRWWLPVNFLLPPVAAFASKAPVPAEIFLIVFVLLVLVYWNSARTRVPLYLTNPITWRALAGLTATESKDAFLDIGSGIGGAALFVARQRPDMKVSGIESAPIPFAISWVRWKLSGLENLKLIYGDMWTHDLGAYDMVYAFLSPAPMPDLYRKASQEMKPGSRLVSNSFVVPEHPAGDILEVDDRRRTKLHIWRMNGTTNGAA